MHDIFSMLQAFAVIFVILWVSMMINQKYYVSLLEEIASHKSTLRLMSVFNLIVWSLLITLYQGVYEQHIWVITLLWWISLLKGATSILFPRLASQILIGYKASKMYIFVASLSSVVLGLLLGIVSFR
jgi:hypothetical protein